MRLDTISSFLRAHVARRSVYLTSTRALQAACISSAQRSSRFDNDPSVGPRGQSARFDLKSAFQLSTRGYVTGAVSHAGSGDEDRGADATDLLAWAESDEEATSLRRLNKDQRDAYLTGLHPHPTARDELGRVLSLVNEMSETRSTLERVRILASYPDLKDLLHLVLSQQTRFYFSSSSLRELFFVVASLDQDKDNNRSPWRDLDLFRPLLDIFGALTAPSSFNRFIGAREFVVLYLVRNNIGPEDELFDVFCNLLDRKPVPGIGLSMLAKVQWERDDSTIRRKHLYEYARYLDMGDFSNDHASSHPAIHASQTVDSAPGGKAISTDALPAYNTDASHATSEYLSAFPTISFSPSYAFSLALGTGLEAPYDQLLKTPGRWYVSRKLDGIRVMALLDFHLPAEAGSPISLVDVNFLSRTGKPFLSLEVVERALRRLLDWDRLGEMLARDPQTIRNDQTGQIKRLCLDGEVCLMRPRREDEAIAVPESEADSHAVAVTTEPWADDSGLPEQDYIEDFKSTMAITKKKEALSHPSYFIFDVLPWSEVEAKEHVGAASGGLGRTFGQRIEDCQALSKHFDRIMASQVGEGGEEGEGGERVVRVLTQWPVDIVDKQSLDSLNKYAKRWLSEGWEGLILRKDALYKGKRSRDIYKIKTVQDAEYVVIGTTNSMQSIHLPSGVTETRLAMATAEISHKGTTVSVGSGWTAEQRIRYCESPEELVGKEITVEYFGESEKEGREGKSLRHPRVKQTWDQGKREI